MLGRNRLGTSSGRRQPTVLNGYVTLVAVAGLAVLGLALHEGWATFRQPSLALWVLVALAVGTEVAPVSSHPWLPNFHSSTTSTPFVLAVLAQWNGAAAVIAGAVSSALGDLTHRLPLKKVVFNVGQYSLMYGTMAVVYRALGGTQPFELSGWQVLALLVAGAAGALVNVLATRTVLVLDHPAPLPTALLHLVTMEAQSWAGELGIGIVVLLIAQRVPLLTLLLVLPLLPIHSAFQAAASAQARHAEADAARAEAESARAEAEAARAEAERARAEAEAASTEAEAARAGAEAGRAQAEQVAEERARLIEASGNLIRRMEEVDRQKDELLAAVSHELRTPASSILGVVRTLTQRADRFSSDQYLELLGLVLEQAEQLDRLIGQLLLAAKLQQPQFVADSTTLELVDVATLVRRAGQLAALTYPDRPVDVAAADGLPVRVDRRVVAQVLGNLIGNAAKHTPAGTPVWIELERRGSFAVIAVEDRGPGVSQQHRNEVFERFTQLDAAAELAKSAGGVGLGLYIARQLARAQGGEVLAVDPSRPDRGARFELRLPLAAPTPAPDAPPSGGLASGGGGRGRVAGGRAAP